MSEAVERIDRLEREIRRLRGWIFLLALALIATFALGATQCAPEEMTLRKLSIVDDQGNPRIVASSHGSQDGRFEIGPVDPGTYKITMTANGKTYTSTIQVRPDPMTEGK